jgi:hypothetical protein
MIAIFELLTAMLQDPFFVAAYNLFSALFALPGMGISLLLTFVFGV